MSAVSPTPPSPSRRTGARVKSPELLLAESGADLEGHGLRRTMGLFQLVCFGVGAIVGTGIFVGLSDSVAEAGPAVVVSFVLAAVTCIFTAFSFAELGGAIPVSGSSYSFAYATLGERVAFLVGWCLLLEYGVSVSAVAVGWSQYVNELLDSVVGWSLPAALSAGPGDGGVINLPAIVVVMMAATLLVRGIRESARATAAMAVLKIGILVAFCAIAFTAFEDGHLSPFAPEGMAGITAGASVAFFSYIGFDAITTAGEEVKNPRRNIPIAILICIGLVTLLYCAVALGAIGSLGADAVSDKPAALSLVVDKVTESSVGGGIIAFGAVVAIASVVLAVMYGQTRILMSMSRDGLIPRVFERVSPKTRTPVANTWIVAVLFAVPAAFSSLDVVVNLTTIGTLATMAVVNVAVIALRRRNPELKRSFRVPLYPASPVLGVGFCLYLMYGTGWTTWVQFVVFLAVGALVYALYSRSRSRLVREPQGRAVPGPTEG
ncbi:MULTISPECIES: amino acid permease [Streptomyces]|uniref:Amino acid permease-associated region n=2 Tax=Streptomyces TaxID=1883 RepID=A0A8D3WDL5_STRFA|nr:MULTISPECIES: amino acid permease [Streptomyces]MDF9869513.1 APA family basic amino acid/polyamine antiporter [Streptomyces pratensis]RAS27319.1 amino acid/polyamine/organocation transporter (APC superfamily) [Streptomyces avidinii]SNX80211.1 amino acid/polyamine/organocation transporter, APC superfamily [Streptomyces microflavus]AGJ57931.1 putative amino acid permease [Streptomyces sp. PAMC 26508]MCY1654229.1 amino acid permease [Streptomyces sp. SL203]